VGEILVRQLQVRAVVVGDNFRFGHRQAGNVKLLRELGMRDGFDVIVHEPVVVDGESCFEHGDPEIDFGGRGDTGGTNAGRAFALTGEVVDGRNGDGAEVYVSDFEFAAGAGIAAGERRGTLRGRCWRVRPSSHRSVTKCGGCGRR